MRRTLASPILAISSNNPSAIFAEALSASIRTARRGERSSEGMAFPKKDATSVDGYTDVRSLAARPDFFRGGLERKLGSSPPRRRHHTAERGSEFGRYFPDDAADLRQALVGDAAGHARDGNGG